MGVHQGRLVHTSVGSVSSLSGLPCGVSATMYSFGIELCRDKADLKSSALEHAISKRRAQPVRQAEAFRRRHERCEVGCVQ